MGVIVPLLSNIGPTREALSKNLRTSLDASRRNADESVSYVVQKLQLIGMSKDEIITGLYLVVFGLVTYYVIPLALLLSNYGMFFFTITLIMASLLFGLILLIAIILPGF